MEQAKISSPQKRKKSKKKNKTFFFLGVIGLLSYVLLVLDEVGLLLSRMRGRKWEARITVIESEESK